MAAGKRPRMGRARARLSPARNARARRAGPTWEEESAAAARRGHALYGDAWPELRAREAALTLQFDRACDRCAPQPWPAEPLWAGRRDDAAATQRPNARAAAAGAVAAGRGEHAGRFTATETRP